MPRNAGTFSLVAGNPVISGTPISSTVQNATMADIANALTNSLPRDGSAPPTANTPMGNFKFTGLADGSAASDSSTFGQMQEASTRYLTSVSGTNTITAMATLLTAYAAGQSFKFIAPNNTSGSVTIDINGLGAKNLTKVNELVAGNAYIIIYDGVEFQLVNPEWLSINSVTSYALDKSTQGAPLVNGRLDVTLSGNAMTVSVKTINSGVSGTTGLVGGAGYTNPPLVSFSGGGGTGAEGYTTVNAGSVTGLVITKAGKNYTSPPVITLTPDGGGTGASVTAVIGNPSVLDPVIATVRSSSPPSGIYDVINITTPLSITVPSGATLGTVNGVQSRIWVSLFNNSGTPQLAVINLSTYIPYGDDITSNAAAISGTANLAGTPYSNGIISGKGLKVLGYIQSTQTTAGLWASTPSRVSNVAHVYNVEPVIYGITSETTTSSAPYIPANGETLFRQHGQSQTPLSAKIALECVVSDAGYSVGDRVFPSGQTDLSNVIPLSVYTDATNCVALSIPSMRVAIINKSTGLAVFPTANAWRYYFIYEYRRT